RRSMAGHGPWPNVQHRVQRPEDGLDLLRAEMPTGADPRRRAAPMAVVDRMDASDQDQVLVRGGKAGRPCEESRYGRPNPPTSSMERSAVGINNTPDLRANRYLGMTDTLGPDQRP